MFPASSRFFDRVVRIMKEAIPSDVVRGTTIMTFDRSKPSTTPKSQTRSISQSGGFRFWEGLRCSEMIAATSEKDCSLGFVVCLQRSGRATVRHDGRPLQVGANEALLIAAPRQLSWQPLGEPADCIMISGGPIFSLRFRLHRDNCVRLCPGHPIALLLSDSVQRLKDLAPATDYAVIQQISEIIADLIEIAIDESDGVSDKTFLTHLARIEDQLDSSAFGVADLAGELRTALRLLQKQFREFNTTPREWMSQRRLERARRRLDNPRFADLSIKQIALATGFRDFSNFSRSFKSAFGVSPRMYRR